MSSSSSSGSFGRADTSFQRSDASRYDHYKIGVGRSLLLGLEVLVAADIVKTIAIELTFVSLGLLAGLVLVRTFLSWTLVLEIEGRWPWQREPAAMRHGGGRERTARLSRYEGNWRDWPDHRGGKNSRKACLFHR